MRRRRIEPRQPGGEPTCTLTPGAARARRVPIDRLLEAAEYGPTDRGYEIRLPSGDTYWRFANRFIEEEAACCASFGFEVRDERDATIIRAAHGGIPS